MNFKATDLAFQVILNDQRLDFKVLDMPGGGAVLANGGAVTCGPTNPKGPYVVNCNIGFSDKGNFERLRDALNEFMQKMNDIDVT
jgi:hypothetical protein